MFIQVWASMVIDFSRMTRWIPTFLEGVGVTIVLSLVTVTIGSILGLFITLLRRSHLLPVSALAKFYILFIRGTPLLVQLYVWLYALPLIGIVIPPLPVSSPVFGTREFSTAVIALGINSSAYVAGDFAGRSGCYRQGTDRGSALLGLSSRQNMQYVVIHRQYALSCRVWAMSLSR